MTRQEEIDRLKDRIAQIDKIMAQVENAGQSFDITSISGGRRATTMIDYKTLVAEREKAQAALNSYEGKTGTYMGIGW